MPAPASGGAGTYLTGVAGTTAAIPVPSGVAADDVVLVHLYLETTAAVTAPSDFTELSPFPSATGAKPQTVRTFWKRAIGADSGTYGFSWTGSAWRDGVATRWTGCITTGSPIDAQTSAARSSSGTTTPAVSLTTTGADRRLVWSGSSWDGGAWTPPSGWTEHVDSGALGIASLAQAAAGSTASITGVCAVSSSQTAWLLALIPPDPATTVTDTITATDAWSVAETVTVGDTITAADEFVTSSAATADTVTAADAFTVVDGDIVAGGDAITAADSWSALDVTASTLLPLRPGPTYEALVMARVPAVAGPPTLLVVDDIRWTTLDWTTELSKPQSATLTCAVSTLSEAVKQRLRSPAALATELWLLRDGQTVFAGPLTGGRRQGEELTLNADGLLAYLGRMVVYSDLVFAQVDQFAIVKALVDHWQSRPYGHFGIDTSAAAASGVLRDATYLRTELHKVLQRVQEMGQRLSGFDVDVDPASRQLQLWFPQRGVDRSSGEDAIVFDDRDITSASTMFSVAAEDVATVGFGTGTSSDSGTLYATSSNLELLAQYGASGVSGTWDSVSEQPTLDGHVAGLVAARAEALFVPGPDVRVTPDADISAYDAGDTVRYELDDQLGIAGNFRLRSIKVSVASSGVETASAAFV